MISKAIRIHQTGTADVLRWDDVPRPTPGPTEALIRQQAVGLNFIDVYFRNGIYKLPSLPAVIGMEGAGTVEAIGNAVTNIVVGDRVAYAGVLGAYTQWRTLAADRLIKLPETISTEAAAAAMLQGMTARYLVRTTHDVGPADTILVHAAAGGVGLILCQWARHLGATVIGVASTADKAALARAHGAHEVLIGTDNLAGEVKRVTKGGMVSVVYDGTGQATFYASLDCLRPRGLMVSYGNATGEVKGVDLGVLAAKGSLFVTRPVLATHIATKADLTATADDLFAVIASGAVKILIGQRFALKDAADAHRALEARQTTGSTVLIP